MAEPSTGYMRNKLLSNLFRRLTWTTAMLNLRFTTLFRENGISKLVLIVLCVLSILIRIRLRLGKLSGRRKIS